MAAAESPDYEYVQPIALLRSGTHEDAVRAVALASVMAYALHPEEPQWDRWLSGPFAKSVRRAKKRGPFEAVAAISAARVHVGEAEAAAFIPTTYPEMDPALAKLQVSGTNFERTGRWVAPAVEGGPRMFVNESLGMSTGKTAAQAAHGLFAWYERLDYDRRTAWVEAGAPFSLTSVPEDQFTGVANDAYVLIEDAGRTEIKKDSATVAVLF